MPTANIKHRDTIERIYPLEAFACDAARNGRVTNQLVHGVRILSAPNAAGDFELERASQQVGEAASAAFLAPHRCDERLINAGRDSPTSEATRPDPREGMRPSSPRSLPPPSNLVSSPRRVRAAPSRACKDYVNSRACATFLASAAR
ncbi:MAG TPA: hypothetical protein VE687_13145 [Stellaceae bacterium]|nr:hypothetical protein [Stellaceae bacterium]